MGQLVKVKIRPGKALEFPAVCVHCSRAASERMLLRKRIGRLTRTIDVPLCQGCHREVKRLSGEEERWIGLGRVGSAAAGLMAALVVAILIARITPLWLNLLIAIAVGALAIAGAWSLFRRKAAEKALPEKKTILNSVQMADFSWRATTFEFENRDFAERFADLNRSRLMESQPPASAYNGDGMIA